MRTIIVGVFLILISVTALTLFSSKQNPKIEPGSLSPQPTPTSSVNDNTDTTETSDKRATFLIFTNGTKRIFSDTKYHNLSSDVYIQSDNPNIIYVKKTGITWSDFFETLPMKLTSDCLTTGTGQVFCTKGNQTLKFYINGELDSDALSKSINDGDRLLVSFGSEEQGAIDKQFQQVPTVK